LVWAGIVIIGKLTAFNVKQSDITTNVQLNKTVSDHIVNNSIFTVDLDFVASSIMKGHPEYKNISIKKNFPSKIVIEVDKRGSFAQIKGKKYYPVDKEAVVLNDGSIQAYENLIPIEYSSTDYRLKRGQHIKDKNLGHAFDLIESISREVILAKFVVSLVNTVNDEGSYFLMQSKDSDEAGASGVKVVKVIVGKDKYSAKIKILKDLLDGKLREKMPHVKYIDLRHKKVYVGFRR
jgi:cell division septal protein FtsQ